MTNAPHGRLHVQRDAVRSRIVGADDHALRSIREIGERCLEGFHAAVALEMIRFHVVHNRDRRQQRQKSLVVFVGLDDEQVVATDPGVASPCSDTAAGESRGISPGGRERLCHHHCGGRLAMRACDRHDALSPASDQLSQRIGAPHNRQTQGAGPLQLRVLPRDRGRNYNRPSPFHVARIVAPPNENSQSGQVIGTCPGSIGITTSYGDSPVPGNESQCAHPRPGYAHEVDGSGIPGSKQGHLWAANIRNLRNLRKL